jgi:F0F1-type ATP synthase assembly protein I
MINETNTVAVIASKPISGISLGITAILLKYIGIVTPYITFLVLIIGLIASIYSLLHNYKVYQMDNLNYKKNKPKKH